MKSGIKSLHKGLNTIHFDVHQNSKEFKTFQRIRKTLKRIQKISRVLLQTIEETSKEFQIFKNNLKAFKVKLKRKVKEF